MFLWFNSAFAAPAPKSLPPNVAAKLRALLKSSVLQSGHVGLAIEALGTVANPQQFPAKNYDGGAHPLLFAVDADKRFMPASNLKLFTAALALQQLGPEHKFATRVFAASDKSAARLVGGGDPSLTGDDVSALAKQIAPVLRVSGAKPVFPVAIVADGNAFRAEQFEGRYPSGWTLDDAIWYYGPSISALAINRNQVDVTVTGALTPELPALVSSVPRANFPVNSQVLTVSSARARTANGEGGDPLTWDIARPSRFEPPALSIFGQLAPRQTVTEGIAVPDPEAWAAQLFADALKAQGTRVGYVSVYRGAPVELAINLNPRDFIQTPSYAVAAVHNSPPVSFLLQKFLKTSDNLYGEMLLRDAALYGWSNRAPDARLKDGHAGTAPRAHALMRAWLHSKNINDASLRFEDGCGLSRYNMVTPRSLVELLRAAQTLPGAHSFYNALPIAGVDGTLKKRMIGTSAQNNARAKTGTFSIASNLSGYVTTRDGHRLAVSVMTNFAPDTQDVRRFQDAVFALLAGSSLNAK